MGLLNLSTFTIFKNIDGEKTGLKVLNEKELHDLQGVLFGMLKEFDAVCEKNSINYSLCGGSSLGAVRHNGFIPWDDDVDIFMHRDDFENLKKVFEKELGRDYWLHTPEDTEGFGLGIGRIRKKNTICKARDDIYNEECGVYIDIFIIENTYDTKLFRCIHGVMADFFGLVVSCRVFYRNRDFYKSLVKDNEDALKVFKTKILLGKLVSWLSVDKWVHAWNNINKIYKNNNSRYVVCPVGRKHFFGECYLREKICDTEKVNFTYDQETVKLRMMKDPGYYLTILYGDYMKIPPEEEREKHIVLDFKI